MYIATVEDVRRTYNKGTVVQMRAENVGEVKFEDKHPSAAMYQPNFQTCREMKNSRRGLCEIIHQDFSRPKRRNTARFLQHHPIHLSVEKTLLTQAWSPKCSWTKSKTCTLVSKSTEHKMEKNDGPHMTVGGSTRRAMSTLRLHPD